MQRWGPLAVLVSLIFAVGAAGACGGGGDQASTELTEAEARQERVFFIEPADGAEVVSPVLVKMGTEGLAVRKPFEFQIERGYGHHHLFIDDTEMAVRRRAHTTKSYSTDQNTIAHDSTHLHFHESQTETLLSLEPGKHTLTLIFGDDFTLPHEPFLTETITITVVAGEGRVFLVEPEDEAQIKEFPFTVEVGSEGIDEGSGHYVIAWGVDDPYPPEGQPVPSDDRHFHFEPGESQAQMDLTGGKHSIHVIFVDENNMVIDPSLADSISVTIWKAVTDDVVKGTVRFEDYSEKEPTPEPDD
jgi:hypothetical protein